MSKQDSNCNKEGCLNQALFYVVLEIRPPEGCGDVPALGELRELKVCLKHKEEGKVEDFVSDEGWDQIVSAFNAMGLMKPERSRTTISFRVLK